MGSNERDSALQLLPETQRMNVRAHLFISGYVQGVFFRSETSAKAEQHKVKGWIRNLDDGRVEAIFEGEQQDVNQIIEFCKHGSRRARVTNIEVSWEPYTGEFQDFQIRY
jgi:acylphosphatase